MNHRWGEPDRMAQKTERTCQNGCGIVKVSFRQWNGARDIYWTEFWRGLDKIAGAGDGTPKCEPVGVTADA